MRSAYEKIAVAMREKGVSNYKIAKKTGDDQTFIGRVLKGTVPMPDRLRLVIAEMLDLDPEDLRARLIIEREKLDPEKLRQEVIEALFVIRTLEGRMLSLRVGKPKVNALGVFRSREAADRYRVAAGNHQFPVVAGYAPREIGKLVDTAMEQDLVIAIVEPALGPDLAALIGVSELERRYGADPVDELLTDEYFEESAKRRRPKQNGDLRH